MAEYLAKSDALKPKTSSSSTAIATIGKLDPGLLYSYYLRQFGLPIDESAKKHGESSRVMIKELVNCFSGLGKLTLGLTVHHLNNEIASESEYVAHKAHVECLNHGQKHNVVFEGGTNSKVDTNLTIRSTAFSGYVRSM